MDSFIAGDLEKTALALNTYSYCENDPVNNIDSRGNIVAKIIIRAIIGAIIGAATQYLSDVLDNLYDCVVNNNPITKKIWNATSSIAEYITAIISGALEATLKIGVIVGIIISVSTTIINHISNFKRDGFNLGGLVIDLLWGVLLGLVTSAIGKKFTPKQGKKLNAYIRKQFNVKGSKAYAEYGELLTECVEWNCFFISTLINMIKDSVYRIIKFVKEILQSCIVTSLEGTYGV